MPRLDTALEHVKGIGPHRARQLAERGYRVVEDLLYHLPFRHEDRSHVMALREVDEGTTVTVRARVVQGALRRTRRRNVTIFTAVVDDGTASMRAVFFNQPYLERTLAHGTEAVFFGKVARDRRTGAIQLENPSFEVLPAGDGAEEPDQLVPIHVKLPGYTPRGLRRLIRSLLDDLPDDLPDTLPPGIATRHGLLDRRRALREVHFPPPGSERSELARHASEAHRRLAFEELFAMQCAFLLARRAVGLRPADQSYETTREMGARLRALLPFRLTPGQRAAFRDIVEDLRRPRPMSRLVQGDVGSGKTIVALLAMLLAADNGHQAALMAPTELLAEQHARNFRTLLAERRDVGLLTAATPARERREVLAGLRDGSLRLVVGTHALIQDAVRFARLALVVVDEQHRFGVEQRARLAGKGRAPDVLILSATPIPRTLALTLHGDLDVSTIADRPPGRLPVKTVVRDASARERVVRFLWDETGRGRQAYVVHPLVEETAEADVRAAVEGAALLSDAISDRRIGLVHGRLRPEERDQVMREFAEHRLDVLVATTVIEVGIDVPNATVMVIENAERFGLSQLHQLRGRVGRGAHRSWCVLVCGPLPTPEARQRLSLLAGTDDGFALAEADLALRGAGEFFGTRQAGVRDLRVADPVRDKDLLLAARREAVAFVDGLSHEARTASPLVRAIEERWHQAVERSAVG